MPLAAHIKEHPAYFHRFDVLWTPTVLVLDSGGKERWRIEGYLPRDEFRAQLELGLARVDFMHKRWAEAEERYGQIVQRYSETVSAAEALYWQAVSHYKGTNDHTVLGKLVGEYQKRYTDTLWAKQVAPWSG